MGFTGIAVGAAMVSVSPWWIACPLNKVQYSAKRKSPFFFLPPPGWPEAHLRVHDLQLLHASHRPGHQLCGQDALHVSGAAGGAHRLPGAQRSLGRRRRAALAVLRCLVRCYSILGILRAACWVKSFWVFFIASSRFSISIQSTLWGIFTPSTIN